MRLRKRGATVVELMLACSLLSLLSLILLASLRQVTVLWQKIDAKDDGVRQLVKARTSLLRDLANSSSRTGDFAVASVGPNLGAGKDSDALTFLSSDTGNGDPSWTVNPNGQANFACQITYYCVIPNLAAPPLPLTTGAPDAQG